MRLADGKQRVTYHAAIYFTNAMQLQLKEPKVVLAPDCDLVHNAKYQ